MIARRVANLERKLGAGEETDCGLCGGYKPWRKGSILFDESLGQKPSECASCGLPLGSDGVPIGGPGEVVKRVVLSSQGQKVISSPSVRL